MRSIQKISLGKDFKTANVEILTQDGNLRKLKLTYDDVEGSLRALTMSEQHYVTVGRKIRTSSQQQDHADGGLCGYCCLDVRDY